MQQIEQSWRWFGPRDPITLKDIKQTGATGIVTALHHIPVGDIWTVEEINTHKKLIEAEGLQWNVVESLNIHEDIKRRKGNFQLYIDQYKISMKNLAECGLKVITYNFMPVLDWVRTDLNYIVEDGSKAMYFDRIDFLAFDLFILGRENAEKEISAEDFLQAKNRYGQMSEATRQRLLSVVLSGIPGAKEAFTVAHVKSELEKYKGIDADLLRQHLILFLSEIIPLASSLGIKMAIHPDDPPFSVLGLPRIACTESDFKQIFNAVPAIENGLCYCTGSLGVSADNDLPGIIERLGDRIHFLHLRSTQRLDNGNFFEANHLEGNVSMFEIMKRIVELMHRCGRSIPMRPDHGHQMLDDLQKEQIFYGYSLIGRLRGLAELRGLEMGIARSMMNKGM